MPPQKIGMHMTYTTKPIPFKTTQSEYPPPVRNNTYTKMGGFQSTYTMSSILRTPSTSCSSCGH